MGLNKFRLALGLVLIATTILGVAQTKGTATNPGSGAFLPGQAAADVLKDVSGADGAFISADILKSTYKEDNLATLLAYPTDDIVVLKLKGSEIREAFERSVSLYPQQSPSFLQISGFSVEFSSAGDPYKRILNVTANGGQLDENHVYQIAMPSTLGQGGSGYFKIWGKSKIAKTIPHMTVEAALKGKKFVSTSARWVLR